MVFAQKRMLWAHPRALKIAMKSLVGTDINRCVKAMVNLSLSASFNKIELCLFRPSSLLFVYSLLIYSSVASFMYVLECSLSHNCSTATYIFLLPSALINIQEQLTYISSSTIQKKILLFLHKQNLFWYICRRVFSKIAASKEIFDSVLQDFYMEGDQ